MARAGLKSNGVFVNLWARRSVMQRHVGPPSERSFTSLPVSVVAPQRAVVGQWPVSGSPLSSEFHLFLPPILTLSLHQQIPPPSLITVPFMIHLSSIWRSPFSLACSPFEETSTLWMAGYTISYSMLHDLFNFNFLFPISFDSSNNHYISLSVYFLIAILKQKLKILIWPN